MSLRLIISASPQSHFQGFNESSSYTRISSRFLSAGLKIVPVNRRLRHFCSVNSPGNVFNSPDAENYDHEELDARPQGGKTKTPNEFYVAPTPGRMGYLAAVERFVKVLAMVWTGSQVTKLVRAGGVVALAPFVDKGLSWFTAKFNFKSQGKAFVAIVGFCFGLAILMFFVVTLLSA